MSYLTFIARLFHHLQQGLRFAHHACRVADHLDTAIQASNASGGIKTQSTAFKASAHALCAAIEAYIASLPVA